MNIPLPVHLAILRGAALIVPSQQRAEWFAEWRSELWHVCETCNREATAFCLGAFHDAFWVRRNSPSPKARSVFHLESPLRCGLLLAILAAVSLYFAIRLPGAHDMILPSPYGDADNLVMISTDGRFAAGRPTIPVEAYQSLRKRVQRQFTGIAYYQPILTRVQTARGRTAELSIALATDNLFQLLDMPVTFPADPDVSQHRAALILSRAAWRKYFDADPHIAGRVLEVAGEQVRVAGVISGDSWRLPGRMDGWILDDEQRLAALPAQSRGFMLARVRTPAIHPERQWRLSVPNEQGGYDGFECTSLTTRQLVLPHLLVLLLAFLILPATTSLALGEYPANGHSPHWATRLRRWIFLAIKIELLVVIVFCGYLDLMSITSTQMLPHGLLVGYVLAFRWALMDQRRRCPVCLRWLTNPTRIGRPSQTFLEWYGTELMCAKGHGLLHVPEIPTSCYSTQRWLYLDPSWSSLFS